MASESKDFLEEFGHFAFAELNNPSTFDFESSFTKFLSGAEKGTSPFFYLSHTRFGNENESLDNFEKSFERYLNKK